MLNISIHQTLVNVYLRWFFNTVIRSSSTYSESYSLLHKKGSERFAFRAFFNA